MNQPLSTRPEKALAQLQSTSLTRLVAEAIEDLVLSGALAQRFGISRSPLREAMRTLEESGLIRQKKTAAPMCARSR